MCSPKLNCQLIFLQFWSSGDQSTQNTIIKSSIDVNNKKGQPPKTKAEGQIQDFIN